MALVFRSLNLGPLDNNTYVITCESTGETAVVDVGFEPEAVVALIAEHGLRVRWLLGTHAHYDHAAGMLHVQRAVGGTYALHPADRPLLAVLSEQGRMFGFPPAEAPEVGLDLAHGQRVPLGEHELEVRCTPGHAPGHVVFRHDATVWSGDVLFRESVGRTDLPGGSWEQLVASVHEQLFPLDDAVRCLPGHGPATTIGHERRHNPFVGQAAGYR